MLLCLGGSHVALAASMVRLQPRLALAVLCLANAMAHLHPPPEKADRWNSRVYQGMVSPRGRTAREPGEEGGGAATKTRRRLRPITLKQVGHPRLLVLLASCSADAWGRRCGPPKGVSSPSRNIGNLLWRRQCCSNLTAARGASPHAAPDFARSSARGACVARAGGARPPSLRRCGASRARPT